MMLSVTKAVHDVTCKRFQDMMLNEGAFPEVGFSISRSASGHIFESYSLFEYSDLYARFMKLVDKLMKENLDPSLGVYTRKHSKSFLAEVQGICDNIKEPDVLIFEERFRSIADGIRGYA